MAEGVARQTLPTHLTQVIPATLQPTVSEQVTVLIWKWGRWVTLKLDNLPKTSRPLYSVLKWTLMGEEYQMYPWEGMGWELPLRSSTGVQNPRRKIKQKQNNINKNQCSCWKEDLQRWWSQGELGLEKPGPKLSYFLWTQEEEAAIGSSSDSDGFRESCNTVLLRHSIERAIVWSWRSFYVSLTYLAVGSPWSEKAPLIFMCWGNLSS